MREARRMRASGAVLKRVALALVLFGGVAGLSGCAAGLAAGVAQSVLINYAPDMFASMMGQYGTRLEFKETVPYFQKQDWKGLTELARRRAAAYPQRGEWWEIAGYGHLQLGELTQARESFERTLKLMPEEAGAWNLYAYTLKGLGDREGALRAINHALQVDPSAGTSYVLLGDLNRESGLPQPAARAYQRALEIDVNDAFAWYGMGLLAKKQKDAVTYDKAREALRQLNPPLATQLEKA